MHDHNSKVGLFQSFRLFEDNNREFDLGFKRGKTKLRRLGDMDNLSKLYLPEDIVEQILLRLPPKSLMRFKCVCNSWCNLIKSPNLIAKQLSNSLRGSSTAILFKHSVKEHNKDDVETRLSLCNINDKDDMLSTVVEDLNVSPPMKTNHPNDVKIAGHCDGIICLSFFLGNVVLCNPAIKEFKLLPKSFLLLPEDDEHLIFEIACYSEHLGFGYDPKGKDYKVVRYVSYDKAHYWHRAEVYTLGSNSWREIGTNDIHVAFFDQPLFLMGIVYWRIGRCAFGFGGASICILSFDMGDEVFHDILIPELPDGYKTTLAIWKESIALFTYQDQIGVAQSYDIWVMTSDVKQGSWTKQVTIGAMEGVEMPLIYPLVFWKDEELLMVTNDGHVVFNKLGMQTCRYLPIYFVGDFRYTQALVYVNSIVSINGGNKLEGIHHSAFYGVEILADGSWTTV